MPMSTWHTGGRQAGVVQGRCQVVSRVSNLGLMMATYRFIAARYRYL